MSEEPNSSKGVEEIAKKFAEGAPVSLKEHFPSTYKGKPASVILNAATVLLNVDVKNPADEIVRNIMVAGILENLSVDPARTVIERKAPGKTISPVHFPRFLNHLTRNTSELRSFVLELNTEQALAGLTPSADGEGIVAKKEAPEAEAVSKTKKETPLEKLRTAWGKGEPLSDYEELRICDLVSRPENIALLSEIGKLSPEKPFEMQHTRILLAGEAAVEAICKEAMRDAHEYARETSKSKRKDAKARLKEAQKAVFALQSISPEFPEIKKAREAIGVSLNQPYLSNGKISLASSLIEQGKGTDILDSVSPDPGVVTGFFARDRMGQLLTSTKMTPETAEWAVNYLGDCIRRAPGEERAKAISSLLQESAALTLARQIAIEEAASIASRLPHEGQKAISRRLHAVSRKADFGSPEKTLFMDFATEIRKQVDDPRLFPITVEERQKAGSAFRKDTTVIMTAFHTAAEKEERAAKEEHPLTELLAELERPAAARPPEPTANVVLDRTVLLTPQTLANKFARGEEMVLEDMDPKIFAGQPAHRILNAANVLLSVKIPEVEKGGASVPNERLELARNRLVASLLSELEEEEVLPVLEKRHGGPLPEGALPKTMLASMLMGMHDNAEGLKGITREFLSVCAQPDPKYPARAAEAPPPEPIAKAGAPAAEDGEEASKGAPRQAELPTPTEPEPIMESGEAEDPLPDRSVLKAMHTLSSSKKTKHRKAAYEKLRNRFVEGEGSENPQLDLIRGISSLFSIPAKDAESISAGRLAAEALLSLPKSAGWGPVESQEIRKILASANPEYVNPAILCKLNGGTEAERGEALLILVERAEINGRVVREGTSLYEIALAELIGMGEASAVPALFSLAESNCPKPLLLEFLTAYEPEVSGKEAIGIILAKRSSNAGSLFVSEDTGGQISDEKAMAAIQVLQFFGGSARPMSYEEEFIAKGAAKVPAASAIKFLIQGMKDSEDAFGLEDWKGALREISGQSPRLAEETESLLISSFYLIGNNATGAAFDLLSERPSEKQADFLLSLAAAQNEEYSKKAESVLANYDFSSLNSAQSFAIMRWMHTDGMPPGKGAQFLKGFLPNHRADAADWMDAQYLSGLFMDSEDSALAAEAREALIASAENILASKHGVSGVDNVLGALSSKEAAEVSELAAYALASEMRKQKDNFSPDFHKALFRASRKFRKEGDDHAICGVICAARAAATAEAMRQVLVPYLAAEETFSGASAKALLSSTEGAHQLALAAGMENHPAGLPEEGAARISQNAFSALSQADTEFSSGALVSLLRNKKDDLHLSAYEALQKAGDSKSPALLGLLSSTDSWERYAATKLLPQREEFVSKVLPLSIDADTSVSASAMDYVLSATGAKGLASILSNPEVPEETQQIQQALSTYCARNKPAVLKEILEVAQTEGKEAEETIRALEFFPTDISFPALLTILDSGKSTAAIARETLVQMCWLLSTGVGGEDAENAAHDLFEVYAYTSDPEVRDAIVDAARGPFAEFMLEDAIKNENHAHSALGIFLSTENTTYSVEVAQYLKGSLFLSREGAEGLPPLWQVLFAADLGRMAEIKPGTTEHKVLQEAAELEFMHGQGSRESKELLFAFMQNFGSRQVRDSLFERGPLGVSEFLWSIRDDPSEEKAVLWLRSMKDEDANLLLDVLVEQNYSALDKLLENPELTEAVFSHAMRRALFSFAELSKENGSADEGKAREGLELYSQLLSRSGGIGMPSERESEFATLQKNIGLIGMITREGNAKGEGMIRSLLGDIRETSSLRASARAEARKRSRAAGPDGLIHPVRPEKLKRGPK